MRDRILDAAENVLVSRGVEALTLDAVAARAQVSKGGLLHHFASKKALISGVVDRLCDQFEAELPPADAPAGAYVRAWLDASIPLEDTKASDDVSVAILAAISGGPEVLSGLRKRYERWQARLADDGLPAETATAVRLAVDGWWLARLLDLAPPHGKVHRDVRAHLESLIEGAL
jgi:AcrR family transcriptional regulator